MVWNARRKKNLLAFFLIMTHTLTQISKMAPANFVGAGKPLCSLFMVYCVLQHVISPGAITKLNLYLSFHLDYTVTLYRTSIPGTSSISLQRNPSGLRQHETTSGKHNQHGKRLYHTHGWAITLIVSYYKNFMFPSHV